MIQSQPIVNIKRYSTRKRSRINRPTQKIRPDVHQVHSDRELIPSELNLLAQDLHTFLECLNQIPEFTDEAVNSSVLSFQTDLKYWASCLGDFKGIFEMLSFSGVGLTLDLLRGISVSRGDEARK